MTYKASYMPIFDGKDPSQGGFKSEEEAWEWIEKNCLCSLCLYDLNVGRGLIKAETQEDKEFAVDHPGGTSCGYEWLVEKEE